MIKKILLLLFTALVVNGQDAPIHHKISAVISPTTSILEVTDEITIDESQLKDGLEFKLHHALVIEKNEIVQKIEENVSGADIGMDKDDAGSDEKLKLTLYKVLIPEGHSGDFSFTVKYKGEIASPVKQSAENYARGFSESAGIIWEKGVYLAGSTYWVPYFSKEMITFNLTTTLPKDWRVVTIGKRTLDETKGDVHIDTWDSPTPQEEVFLIAAAFSEYTYSMGNVDAMAFLRTPDEGMANKYLETTAQYMEMYRKLVGPYPYTKFALVENFWETGYGMPSFTLLGEKIIRFPFILHSSYPHELLHNWWGNSVYVDFEGGNWCEGLTAYMADHLIKEQRGLAEEYRRSTLQKYTNFVTPENDFPISEFLSRHDKPSEAIGYGKVLMVNHMLRLKVGDENFIRAYQKFNRDNKFKRASFDDIRIAFEEVTGEDLKWFFEQWIEKTGAPSLILEDVKVKTVRDFNNISFTLKQTQEGDPFYIDVPITLVTEKGTHTEVFQMNDKEVKYNFSFKEKPYKMLVDAHFDLFRILDPRETPPTFTKAYGAEKTLVILPDGSNKRYTNYKDFTTKWIKGKEDKFIVESQNDVDELPSDKAVMVLGLDNKFASVVNNAIKGYGSELNNNGVRYGKRDISAENNSFFISAVNPKNMKQVVTLLSIGNDDAVSGLARKLPHYGKYSYLAFTGDEPSNIAKGQWAVGNSPLMKILDEASHDVEVKLEKREALATLAPVFSSSRMMETIAYLASDELKGRAIGTPEIDNAADYIAKKFEEYGLQPGSDDGSYFQTWKQDVLDKKNVTLKNVIAIIPGVNPKLSEAVVISAHYDHLGLGKPGAKKGNEGKIHNGADDNASGVAVMLEIAKTLGKTAKPARTIIFVAFTAEESGLVGSRYFVANYKKFIIEKILANLNLDTVGRLFDRKLMVLNSNTAREWKFIFMGTDFTTGVASELITQDLDASDQMAFIENGVPGVQLFYTGIDSDYHVPEDDTEKIDADGLIKVATVAREIVEYLGQREEPMAFTGKAKSGKHGMPQMGKKGGERKAATGTMPDFAYSGEGVKIAGVSEDSPAAKAGILKGDVITAFNGKDVKNLKDYSNYLKEHQPGDTVTFTIERDGTKKDVELTLSER
ncbi:MAG: M20/M25/M40 family metallo-hydrolase [Melioribacteraceae bacterium]|nr:M20/M25/M40 family metallo-hydrolase [Melioribacteraceae bacterium]